MPDTKYAFAQRRINKISESFIHGIQRRTELTTSKSFAECTKIQQQDFLKSMLVDEARLHEFCHIQNGQEMRADYYEYVYDNSFARRRRRLFKTR